METTQKGGLTGFTIKLIAIITMFIDHCGAVFVERKMARLRWSVPNWLNDPNFTTLSTIDSIMRCIGRIAFPLFIFLLVQGFMHTRNRLKYAVRLGLFALISEVPFDMAFKNTYFTMSYQNVFFTLFLGFLFMCVADFIYKKHIAPWLGYFGIILSSVAVGFFCAVMINNIGYSYFAFKPLDGFKLLVLIAILAAITVIIEIVVSRKKSFEDLSRLSFTLLALTLFMICAGVLSTDYNAGGVLAIAVAYAFRESKSKCIVGTVITLALTCGFIEAIAIVDYFFIKKYNGEKGKSMKYFFYAFYPCHLLIIALVAKLLGL
ncbi:MAG: conjugal transfer protein TraX [Lachnospiraceae bacterium]|nr:conjugal transfer protein TraX [Lachnospiraceae bacterium]